MVNLGLPKRKKKEEDNKQKLKPAIMWALIIVIGAFIYFAGKHASHTVDKPKMVEFKAAVTEGSVAEATITEDRVRGKYVPGYKEGMEFDIHIMLEDEEMIRALTSMPNFEKKPGSVSFQIFFNILPVLIVAGFIWFIFYRQMRGAGRGALSFGKSRAKLLTEDSERMTFNDIAGIEEAKEEVQEIIEFLKDPKKFQKLGGRIPKGVMLLGPPGSGKTLLAKAIAGEADVPFFSLSGSDFVEMFVGVGASRVRDLFEQGKRHAPCIIFIDEIDAVGRHRGAGIGGGHDEREQTLNALLVELDGFNTEEGVIIIAATNRPDVLDPALLRPGRFDRQVIIDLPDLKGREEILKVHARKVVLEDGVALSIVARGTPGLSGADLANIINEAALLAARQDKKSIEQCDLEEARDKVLWGSERRSRVLVDEDRKVSAYHEAGHALLHELLEHTDPLHKVTIVPRGMSLGSTMFLPDKDRYLEGRKELLDDITSLLGGRVAEEIMLKDITSGARNDLKRVTELARSMVCEWGMSDKLGPMTFGSREEHIFLGREISRKLDYSEATAVDIDREVRKIIDDCYGRASRMLGEKKGVLVKIADALLEREVLTGEEVICIIKGGELPAVPRDAGKGEEAAEPGTGQAAEGAKDEAAPGWSGGPCVSEA
ncbi:MAG: ATP-dependent zinc metalloprotease FtsH [Candidatus Tritonobacter lacicola]|nr:ATP-dependent zinc metalloprotease FtsH [Candidatus Tritonobacter lacicola]